jgi:lipopolysaccharide export LptBFGC system permease protein LptF
MKPKSILINTLGIILVCFAFACGGERSSQGNETENKSEEAASVESDEVTLNDKKEASESPQYAATEEAEEASNGNTNKDAFFKNENNQGGLDRVFSSSAAKVDEGDTIQ